MALKLFSLVRLKANGRCEYCRLPQEASLVPFEVDHIIARKHRGLTVASNLAWACFYCNSFKGPNIAGLDPMTQAFTRLFHPRKHQWGWHFRWNEATLEGRTAIGRTTIQVLQINCEQAVLLRGRLIDEGIF